MYDSLVWIDRIVVRQTNNETSELEENHQNIYLSIYIFYLYLYIYLRKSKKLATYNILKVPSYIILPFNSYIYEIKLFNIYSLLKSISIFIAVLGYKSIIQQIFHFMYLHFTITANECQLIKKWFEFEKNPCVHIYLSYLKYKL